MDVKTRIDEVVKTLRMLHPDGEIRVQLQSWPNEALKEGAQAKLLIGIRSTHENQWTHDKRRATARPRADAWVNLLGKLLLVFECKNDDYPLDATQMSDYGHDLGLLTAEVPRAKGGAFLTSQEACQVKKACEPFVLDAPWSTVVKALEAIQQEQLCGDRGCWLAGQAAAYIQDHVHPPYKGAKTILDWLDGPDDDHRRQYLRTLMRKMGDQLFQARGESGAITFHKKEKRKTENGAEWGIKREKWGVALGTIAPAYVPLSKDSKLLEFKWLYKNKRVHLNLWFAFHHDEKQRIGIDVWLEAEGGQPSLKGKLTAEEWNAASLRHARRKDEFFRLLEGWVHQAPSDCRVSVYPLKFRRNNKIWKGGGEYVPDGPRLLSAKPEEALAFLQDNQDDMWRFPRVECPEDIDEVAQPLVRKPALAQAAPLEDTDTLKRCGEDARKLQSFLIKAVKELTARCRLEPWGG